MSRRPRRNHSAAFKAKVALEGQTPDQIYFGPLPRAANAAWGAESARTFTRGFIASGLRDKISAPSPLF